MNDTFYVLIECVCLVCQASEDLLGEHYRDLKSKPFFRELVSYMSSGPVVAMVRSSYCTHDHTILKVFRNSEGCWFAYSNILFCIV